ncbi:hypothetical protein LTR66_016060 [Elasticomyces elasticus]|nr:hypothetical protein LTR66_016060 [Elasticomyces elasticus]
MAQQGRSSGGDIFDMAKNGTSVPEDAAEPRHIKSVPRPGQDEEDLGATDLAGAASNAEDIPRTNADTAGQDIITGTGDALPPQVDSKRLHAVPGGVTHDPTAKGSTRYTNHAVQKSDIETGAADGSGFERAPGDESLTEEQAQEKYGSKTI